MPESFFRSHRTVGPSAGTDGDVVALGTFRPWLRVSGLMRPWAGVWRSLVKFLALDECEPAGQVTRVAASFPGMRASGGSSTGPAPGDDHAMQVPSLAYLSVQFL